MSSLNHRLAELRNRAVPPITQEEMAAALGFKSRQGYHHYESESGFKGAHLPMKMAVRIASILGERGVDRSAVMALAGLAPTEIPPEGLTRGEQAWLVVWRALTPGQRRLVLDQLYCSLGWKDPDGEPDLAPALAAAA